MEGCAVVPEVIAFRRYKIGNIRNDPFYFRRIFSQPYLCSFDSVCGNIQNRLKTIWSRQMSRIEKDVERRIAFARFEVERLDAVISEAACKRAAYQSAIDAWEVGIEVKL